MVGKYNVLNVGRLDMGLARTKQGFENFLNYDLARTFTPMLADNDVPMPAVKWTLLP